MAKQTSKRQPRRESSPPPYEWAGEHYAIDRGDGLLVLWSFVRTERGEESAVHRASLRGQRKPRPQISFDSPSLKPKNRRWRTLDVKTLLSLPAEHRSAVAGWHTHTIQEEE